MSSLGLLMQNYSDSEDDRSSDEEGRAKKSRRKSKEVAVEKAGEDERKELNQDEVPEDKHQEELEDKPVKKQNENEFSKYDSNSLTIVSLNCVCYELFRITRGHRPTSTTNVSYHFSHFDDFLFSIKVFLSLFMHSIWTRFFIRFRFFFLFNNFWFISINIQTFRLHSLWFLNAFLFSRSLLPTSLCQRLQPLSLRWFACTVIYSFYMHCFLSPIWPPIRGYSATEYQNNVYHLSINNQISLY